MEAAVGRRLSLQKTPSTAKSNHDFPSPQAVSLSTTPQKSRIAWAALQHLIQRIHTFFNATRIRIHIPSVAKQRGRIPIARYIGAFKLKGGQTYFTTNTLNISKLRARIFSIIGDGMAWSKSTRIIVMLAIDAAFFILELGVGLAVGSLALMADAFHMVRSSISCGRKVLD